MYDTSSSSRLAEMLTKADLHWHTHRDKKQSTAAPAALTIAISRESGAGGTLVARELGALLNWPVYDHELLEFIATELGVQTRILEGVDERGKNWLAECLESLSSSTGVSQSAYVHRLVGTVLSLAAHGACIIVGRGAAHFLRGDSTLRVRLIGPRQERIAAKRRRLGITEEEAARQVDATDRERTCFVKDHFHKDPADPGNYDLILNSTKFSIRQCAELIIKALRLSQEHSLNKASLPYSAVQTPPQVRVNVPIDADLREPSAK
jgi:cytidylate kinase